MKRIVLLGVAILFASSVAMAAGYDVPPDPSTIAAGTYDYLNVGITADANADTSAAVTITGETNIGDDGHTGSLTVDAGASVDFQSSINIGVNGGVGPGTGHLAIEANASATVTGTVRLGFDHSDPAVLGGTGSMDVSGSLDITGQIQLGAYSYASGSCSGSIQGSGSVSTSSSVYLGGGLNSSGDHYFHIDGTASLTSSTDINIGWYTSAGGFGKGHVYIYGSGGGSIEANNNFQLKRGSIHYVVDAGGVTPISSVTGSLAFYGGVIESSTIDMQFADPATQAAYDAMVWDDPARWVVIANAGAGGLSWGYGTDPVHTGPVLTGDFKWELVERTNNVLEAHYRTIPEPTTMALLGLGGLLLALRRRS